jgi:putative membrane protein
MKDLLNARAAFISMLVTGLVGVGVACNNNPDNVKTAEKANAQKTDSLTNKQSVTDSSVGIASRQDADFMVKATAGNEQEVVLGKLAQTNASNPAVKRFGEMMIHDHEMSEKEFRGLAANKHIILPDTISNAQKKEHDDLQKKTGRDFDKAYIKLMVDDHKDDIGEFKKAEKNANDMDIKALAAKTLPILQKHLDTVQVLQKGLH